MVTGTGDGAPSWSQAHASTPSLHQRQTMCWTSNAVVGVPGSTATDPVVASAGAGYAGARSGLAAVCADGVIISDYKRHEEGAVQACRLCGDDFVGSLCGKVGEGGERSPSNYILRWPEVSTCVQLIRLVGRDPRTSGKATEIGRPQGIQRIRSGYNVLPTVRKHLTTLFAYGF
jgi:hypothetical protein